MVEENFKRRIFISHKSKDSKAVEQIVDALKVYTDKIKFDLSANFKPGDQWREEITKCLEKADWLILLYTDPTLDWDWCLWEVGLFEGKMQNADERKLICIHKKNDAPPDPLRKFNSVPADRDKLLNFITTIFKGIREKPLPKEHCEGILEKFELPFREKPNRFFYNDYLELLFNEDQRNLLVQKQKIIGNVEVRSNERSLNIFGKRPKPSGTWIWGEILEAIETYHMEAWVYSLEKSLCQMTKNNTCETALPIFYSNKADKCYRPIIHLFDYLSDNRLMYRIIFVEIPKSDDPRPNDMREPIINVMDMARKFRWGLIDNYIEQMKRLEDDIKPKLKEEIISGIECSFLKIENEAKSLGMSDRGLIAAFLEPDEINKIRELQQKWEEQRQELFRRIKDADLNELLQSLESMKKLINQYLIITSRRYYELNTQLSE